MKDSQTTKPDLNQIAGELVATIGRDAIISGESSPQKMNELIVSAFLKIYTAGYAEGVKDGRESCNTRTLGSGWRKNA